MVLPRQMRLKGYRCFNHLHRKGSRYNSASMMLKVSNAQPRLSQSHRQDYLSDTCRCAVAISNKVNKRAVIRNRLRRLLHHHLELRLKSSSKSTKKWLLLVIRPQSPLRTSSELRIECDHLLHQAGLIQ